MVTGGTKRLTDRVKGNVVLGAAQRDDGDGNPTAQYLLLRADENGRLRVITGGDDVVTGRTKGLTDRAVGNVVLLAAQVEDGEGTPTEEYILLRADENGLLRTVGDAAGAVAFLGLTDTPAAYTGASGQVVQVNALETALEFAAAGGHVPLKALPFDLGGTMWVQPGWGIGDNADKSTVADELYYFPIYLERSTAFTRIGLHVLANVGGASARLGIYAAAFDGDGQLKPDSLTLDAGTVSVATNGEKSIVINETLGPGWHFLAFSSDGAPDLVGGSENDSTGSPITSMRDSINSSGKFVQHVTVGDGAAALPDPATEPTDAETPGRITVFLRI